jgi:hypothetical protein
MVHLILVHVGLVGDEKDYENCIQYRKMYHFYFFVYLICTCYGIARDKPEEPICRPP